MTVSQSPATHLVLVRHGQSLHNRDGQGAIGPDLGLTELGWRQAQAVAGWLIAHYRPAVIVSSSLVRARQTAEVIAARFALPVLAHEGLEEAGFHFWDELPSRWDSPMAAWDHDWQPNPENASLYSSFRARLHDTLDELLTRYAGQTILAITHGGTIGTIMRGLFGGHHVAVLTENTGVTQLTWEVNHWRLALHNSTVHLDALTNNGSRSAGVAPSAPTPPVNNQQLDNIIKHYERVAAAMPDRNAVSREPEGLVRMAAPGPDDHVLDIGTGAGGVALAFAPQVARVVGIDISPAMLERAETARAVARAANVHLSMGDMSTLTLADASFDIVACQDVLKYAADLPALLRRLRRLLTTGGRLVMDTLVATDDPVRRATHNAIELRRDPGIFEVRSAADIERDLTAAGFRIVKAERYSQPRELDAWLNSSAADDATRRDVSRMLEAGLEADSAGLNARRNREGQIVFTESRARFLAAPHDRPA